MIHSNRDNSVQRLNEMMVPAKLNSKVLSSFGTVIDRLKQHSQSSAHASAAAHDAKPDTQPAINQPTSGIRLSLSNANASKTGETLKDLEEQRTPTNSKDGKQSPAFAVTPMKSNNYTQLSAKTYLMNSNVSFGKYVVSRDQPQYQGSV